MKFVKYHTFMNNTYFAVLFCIFMSLVVSSSVTAQSDQFGEIDLVYIDSVEAAPGQEISVGVKVRNDEKLSSLSIPLTYDENILTLKAIDYTGSRVAYVNTKILNPSNIELINGHFVVAVAVVLEEPLAAGDGVIFTAVFEVSEAAVPGALTIIDSLYYPPGGQLVFADDSTTSAIFPAFEAGLVSVVNANRVPVFAPLSDQYVIEGDSMILDIVITDPDFDPINLAVTDKPTGAVFVDNGNGTGRFAWAPAFVGPYSSDGSPFTVGFWASDGELAVEKNIQVQVVNKNRRPEITAEQQYDILAGDSLSFEISAVDPDFENVTLSTFGLPSGAVFDGDNPGTFDWRTAVTDSGTTVLGFIATDPQGFADTALVDVNIDANILGYARRINVDMNDFSIRSKCFDLSRNPVIEARSYSNQQITFLNGIIGISRTMHPEHIQRLGFILVVTAQPQKRHRYRQMRLLGKRPQFLARVRDNNPAAHVKHRLLRFIYCLRRH